MNKVFDGTVPSDPKGLAELVKAVCLGETTSEPWHLLIAPECIERTYPALVDLKNGVMAALARYQADLKAVKHTNNGLPYHQRKQVIGEATQSILVRREAMLRLSRSVDNHIQEAKAARHQAKQAEFAPKPGTNSTLRERIRELEAALRLALTYVDPHHRDDPDIAQAHVVLEAGGAWWHYADAAEGVRNGR